MRNLVRFSIVAGWLVTSASCSESRTTSPDETKPASTLLKAVIVSNSQANSSFVASSQRSKLAVASAIVFVSLPPNSAPGVRAIEIANRTTHADSIHVTVVDGGFDPVAIAANVGDTLALTASLTDGTKDVTLIKVTPRRPPTVVRTNPPRGRTDVALSVVVTLIFSEPVNRATVTSSSLRITKDAAAVPGKIIMQEGSFEASFVPDEPLQSSASYQLAVSTDVRDTDGDALDAPFTSDFGTATLTDAGPISTTGTVVERSVGGVSPVANATVSLRSESFTQQAETDSRGNFAFTTPANRAGRAFLYVTKALLEQPCAVRVNVGESSPPSPTVELVRIGSGLTTSAMPRISGAILSSHLNSTIVGAQVSFATLTGLTIASATTNTEGRFAFCNVPLPVDVNFSHPIISPLPHYMITGPSTPTAFEIDFSFP